jgi:polyhydroxyalkanoate synthesis regulator phasin
MKHIRKKQRLNSWIVAGAGALAAATAVSTGHCATSSDPLLDALVKKGVLTESEAKDIQSEVQTNSATSAISKIKISDAIKNLNVYGDMRFRYEYRGTDNPKAAGLTPGNTYYRERFRYALRFGIKGDLYDNFSYGIRLETSSNPRSTWVTFADDNGKGNSAGGGAPSDKTSDFLNIGQVYLNWHPSDYYEMTVGRMPNPLYTTPMVWDSDLCPEGAFEKFKLTLGNVDLFADAGQFLYQDTNPDQQIPSSDTFMLVWQVGAVVKLDKDMSFKLAPTIYNYTGHGSANGLNTPFVGQGSATGVNPGSTGVAGLNQNGLNDLLVFELPAEFNMKLGKYHVRAFGDFGYNFEGDDRARAAFAAGGAGAFPGVSGPATGNSMAYQAGIGIGNEGPVYGPTQGLVYGSTSKKNTWEARVYWQHVEQYALDVNLLDSDFFEGRGNLEGVYGAFAYSLTDAIIGTVRVGYANQIDNKLGTGGSNFDLPGINPIRNYHLLQADLTWRF